MKTLTRPGITPSLRYRGRPQVIDSTEAWLLRRGWRLGEFIPWGAGTRRFPECLQDASAERIASAAERAGGTR